jgi:hypothetical protein
MYLNATAWPPSVPGRRDFYKPIPETSQRTFSDVSPRLRPKDSSSMHKFASVALLTGLGAIPVHAVPARSTCDGIDPIEGYGLEELSWEVPIFGTGHAHILNGTVEQVREHILAIYPNHVFESPAAAESKNGPLRSILQSRDDDESYASLPPDHPVHGDWERGEQPTHIICNIAEGAKNIEILRGIDYLRRVPGQPRNGPGPGNCGRVSCGEGAGIFWCNDVSQDVPLPVTLTVAGAIVLPHAPQMQTSKARLGIPSSVMTYDESLILTALSLEPDTIFPAFVQDHRRFRSND